jgi:hypothetical protein
LVQFSRIIARSGIRKNLFRIPGPGVKKAPDPGFQIQVRSLCLKVATFSSKFSRYLTPFCNSPYLKEGFFGSFQCLFMPCTLYRTGVVVPVPGWPVPLLHKELEGQRCGANMERFVVFLFFFHKNALHSLQGSYSFCYLTYS